MLLKTQKQTSSAKRNLKTTARISLTENQLFSSQQSHARLSEFIDKEVQRYKTPL